MALGKAGDVGRGKGKAGCEGAAPRRYVSLFSGAMGLDIGLERAGFECAVCNEIDPLAVGTIRLNRPGLPVVTGPAEGVTAEALSEAAGFDVRGIDLLAGGPPCQAFSVFGKRRGLRDGRGRLVFEFLRLVGEVRPRAFLMENVRGLHSMPLAPRGRGARRADRENGSLLRELTRLFEEAGYRADCYLVNAVNYGAPQVRERLLCVGNAFDLDAGFPPPRHSNRPGDGLPAFRTLRDAIGGGFEDPDPSVMDFSPRKLKYLSMVPPGGNWRSLPERVQRESMGRAWHLKGGRSAYWRRLSFDFPCPTVLTAPNHAGASLCHPEELRALTVGEMAAVQEFPRGWRLSGSTADRCRQVGNAVPPRLGEVAGEAIRRLLEAGDGMRPFAARPTPGRVVHIRPHVRVRSYFRGGEVRRGHAGYYG